MLKGFFAAPQVEQRAQATTWGDWPGDNAHVNGLPVTELSALQLLSVAGCVKLITDSIATLPIDVYRRDANGDQFEVETPRWLKDPTIDLDFTAWCTQVLTSLLLHGNCYLAVQRNGSGIVEIPVLDPQTVSVFRDRGMKRYRVNGVAYDGEIVHIKGMMLPGTDVGLSPLEYARQTIGLGLEALSFGADQFQQALNMPGVIEIPKRAQPDQMREMAQAWKRARTRRNRGLPGVLEDGATWRPTGVTNEQAQFLQLRQWTAAEVAAQVFMVDPADLGIPVAGTSLTYANLEQRNIRRVQVTFLPWMIRIEKAISGLMPMPRFMKFNVDGLLRGDSQTRWSIYQTASNINAQAATYGQPPVLLTEEMRDFEDLNAIDSPPATPVPVAASDSAPVRSEPPQVNVTIENQQPSTTTPELAALLAMRAQPPQQDHHHLTVGDAQALASRQTEIGEQLMERIDQIAEAVQRQLDVDDIDRIVTERLAELPAPPEPVPLPTALRRLVERDQNGRIAALVEEFVP